MGTPKFPRSLIINPGLHYENFKLTLSEGGGGKIKPEKTRPSARAGSVFFLVLFLLFRFCSDFFFVFARVANINFQWPQNLPISIDQTESGLLTFEYSLMFFF